MKVLYILKDTETDTLKKFIDIHQKDAEVKVLKIDDTTSAEELLNEIEDADKIISW